MTKLAIVCDLDDWERMAQQWIAERGDDDGAQLLRQLTVSDLIEWVRRRQEETNNGTESDNSTDRRFQ